MTRVRRFALGIAIAVGLFASVQEAAAWFVGGRGWGGGALAARGAEVGGLGGWGGGWRGGCWRCGVAPGALAGLDYEPPYEQQYGTGAFAPPMGAPQQVPMGSPPYPPGAPAPTMSPPPQQAPMASPPYPPGAPAATASPPPPAPMVSSRPPGGAPPGNRPVGAHLPALPSGSRSMVVNNVQYYQNGATWYRPYFGSAGVYYEVVPAP